MTMKDDNDCPTKGDDCICGEVNMEDGCEICGPGVLCDYGLEEEDAEGPDTHDIGFGDILALQEQLRPKAEEYVLPYGTSSVVCAGAGRIRVTLLAGTVKLSVSNAAGDLRANLMVDLPVLVGDLACLTTAEPDDEDENEEAAAHVRIEFLD